MEKRSIKRKDFDSLSNELNYLQDIGHIDEYKKNDMLDSYNIRERANFIQVMSIIGALLLGIGILSFIASNWSHMSNTVKFGLIISMLIGSNLVGFKLKESHPRTSVSMYYLGVFIYGAGIFLVNQMFNIGGDYLELFLWWALGIFAWGYVLKDNKILLLSNILMFGYLVQEKFIFGYQIPWILLVWIVIMYVLLNKVMFSKINSVLVNLLSLGFIGSLLLNIMELNDNTAVFFLLIYFALGWLMVYGPRNLPSTVNNDLKYVIGWNGHVIHGIAGLFLTFSEIWQIDYVNILFGIIYFVLMLWFSQKGNLLTLIIVCALIFRFYVDISYDFLPKSAVFILGGVLLLGMGYIFEKQRKNKKEGGMLRENE